MTVDMGLPARNELLRIAKRLQKRVAALTIRFQSTPSPIPLTNQSTTHSEHNKPVSSTSTSATSAAMTTNITNSPLRPAGPMAMTEAPFQFQLALDALSYLVTQLEREWDDSISSSDATGTGTGASTSTGIGPTPDDLAKLKTCTQAFLTAAYFCLHMATKLSCFSEESCWIGSARLSRAGSVRNTFMEQDWARGRLYDEAHYIFRLGLEDLLLFMKTNPSTIKLFAAFEPSIKELKSESNLRVK